MKFFDYGKHATPEKAVVKAEKIANALAKEAG